MYLAAIKGVGALAGAFGLGRRRPKPPPLPLAQRMPDGIGVLADRLKQSKGQAGLAGQYEGLLSGWMGSQQGLQKLFKRFGPMGAAGEIGQDPAFKHIQDFENVHNVMGAYGPAAGQIAQGAAAANDAGQMQLNRSGLGRSAAAANLASQSQVGAATQQANLYQQLHQRQQAMRASAAQNAVDMNMSLARLALGMTPQTRITQGTDWGAIAGLAGTAVGTVVGGPVGGAVGGALGSAAGGAAK